MFSAMGRPTSREKLLDAAEALFAESGLAAVSLRGVCSAACHSRSTLKKPVTCAAIWRASSSLRARAARGCQTSRVRSLNAWSVARIGAADRITRRSGGARTA
ncbi:MAG: TetR family transcriptional regulator [Proteobacteria bacterium]|nr:TetR family transcriptional regulator [Pseudomonadota bacterium]